MNRAFMVLVLTGVLVFFATIQAQTGEAPPSTKLGTTSTGKAKIDQFLYEFQRSSSLKPLAETFQRFSFSDVELDQLAKELEKPSYAGRISSIKQQGESANKARKGNRYAGRPAPQVLVEKRGRLNQKHKQRLDQVSQEVTTRAHRLSSTMAARAGGPHTPSFSMGAGRMFGARNIPGGGGNASITGIESAPVVGQEIAIVGSGFGAVGGRVAILAGEDLLYCTVSSWRHNRIVARIPQALQPDADELEFGGRWGTVADIPALLWVKLQGGETGPTREISIHPDITAFRPEITAIYPLEVGPGSEMLIEGANFLSQSGWVRLDFGRERLDAVPLDWTNGYIRARVDSLPRGGFHRMEAGMLRLETALGLEASRGGLTFVPEEELVELDTGLLRAICEPRFPPLLCLIGETNHFTRFNDLSLAEGWLVDDSWLELQNGQGPGYGAYFEDQPTPGGSNPTARIAVWADAWSIAEYKGYLTLRGPKGTRYFR